MIRRGLPSVLSVLLVVAVGCTKSQEEPRRAVVKKGGLMPGAIPGFDATYVADQKQVKRIERTVSYEPLESFREGSNTGTKKITSAEKSGKGPAKKKGVFGRLKSMLGEKVDGVARTVKGRGAPTGGKEAARAEEDALDEDDDEDEVDDDDDEATEDEEDEDDSLDDEEDDDDLDEDDDEDLDDEEDEDDEDDD